MAHTQMARKIERGFRTLLFGLLLVLLATPLWAQEECTVGVAVGKATFNGRSLLWKNRDTSHSKNAIYYFKGEKFPFLAVINAGDTTQAWMGVNAAGFAIMNAEAKDLEGTRYDDEGFLMKRALGTCASVADFESLLVRSNASGRAVTSNFGVLDARGNGAFFETGNHTFTRFDAGNPDLAPNGFLVRANFAFLGTGHGYGFQRYGRAFRLFSRGVRKNILSPSFVFQRVARDVTPEAWAWNSSVPQEIPLTLDTRRTVNRYRTASAAIFGGVKKDEDPRLTTFWVHLGEPVCSVCVPLWVASGSVPPELRGPGQPEINRLSRAIHRWVHPDSTRPFLLDLQVLQNSRGQGILQTIAPVENEIVARTEKALTRWRKRGVNPEEMQALQNWAARQAVQVLRKIESRLEK